MRLSDKALSRLYGFVPEVFVIVDTGPGGAVRSEIASTYCKQL
jgi:hypothetical protein